MAEVDLAVVLLNWVDHLGERYTYVGLVGLGDCHCV